MHAHKCPDFDYGVVKSGDPMMDLCTCDPVSDMQARLAAEPCKMHCTVCDGMDHHWMPDCDEDNGMPVMVCKPAKRPTKLLKGAILTSIRNMLMTQA